MNEFTFKTLAWDETVITMLMVNAEGWDTEGKKHVSIMTIWFELGMTRFPQKVRLFQSFLH